MNVGVFIVLSEYDINHGNILWLCVSYQYKSKVRRGVVEMFSKCPGQDASKLRVELYKCWDCGAEVEIFSDETRIKCQKCGMMVFREKMPSCIEWCSSTRQCLGEERWQQLMGKDEKEPTQERPEEADGDKDS